MILNKLLTFFLMNTKSLNIIEVSSVNKAAEQFNRENQAKELAKLINIIIK